MAERLWSGDGCADNPAFKFVRYSDAGVPLYKKVGDDEVRLKLESGATAIVKEAGDAPVEKKEVVLNKSVVAAAITALAKVRYPAESEAVAVSKLMETPEGSELYTLHESVAAAGAAGVSVAKTAAHVTLEAYAAEIRKADPRHTPETAYIEAFNAHPTLARLALEGC